MGTQRWPAARRSGLCLLFVLCLACSTGQKVRRMFGGQLPVQVRVAVDANDDSAVAVDLLVVYDDKLLTELLKTPAADWFSKKQQIVADHPDGVSVQSWEWVPGQPVEPVTIEYRSGARRIVLFADYNTDGPHRAAVPPQQPFRLTLDRDDLKVEVMQ